MLPEIRVAVRTGDTPAHERAAAMARRPPHILVTTPESLYILLTAEQSRAPLRDGGDGDRRRDPRGRRRQARRPPRPVAGAPRRRCAGAAACSASACRRRRGRSRRWRGCWSGRTRGSPAPRSARSSTPATGAISTCDRDPRQRAGRHHQPRAARRVYDRLAELARAHRTTLVFVNTRRLVERVAHALGERLGDEKVAAHHGSLSREPRLDGRAAAQVGRRAGRRRHRLARARHRRRRRRSGLPARLAARHRHPAPAGRPLGPLPRRACPRAGSSRSPATSCSSRAALVRAVRRGELDASHIPERRSTSSPSRSSPTVRERGDRQVEALWALVRRAHPYRDLARRDFDQVLEMLAEGVSTRRGRRRRLPAPRPRRTRAAAAPRRAAGRHHLRRRHPRQRQLRRRAGCPTEPSSARSTRTSPSRAWPATSSCSATRSWRIRRVEAGRVRVVEDARGQPPTIPFWLGEAPARTRELSEAVGDLRREVAERCADAAGGGRVADGRDARRPRRRRADRRVHRADAKALGALPTRDTIVAERFFDEAGGMQLVLHAPLGGRINRAWGLALRKRFCVSFDFELQAAATDDGIVISLGQQHSFPLDAVFSMVRSHSFEQDLIQAALVAPMFGIRWRWNATRALALLRFSGGRRVPTPIQRMRAEDLLAAVFPAQLACGENRTGPIEPVPTTRWSTRRSTTAWTRRWTSRGCGRCCSSARGGRDPRRGARHGGAVAAVARDPQRQPLRLPRRRAARGAPRPRGVAAAHRSGPRGGDRRARRRRPSPRCAARRGPTSATPTSCTTRC